MLTLTLNPRVCSISTWPTARLQFCAFTVLYTTGVQPLSCHFPEHSWAVASTFHSGKKSEQGAQEWSFPDVFPGVSRRKRKKKKEEPTYNLRMNSTPSTSSVAAAVSPGDIHSPTVQFLSGARTHKDIHKNHSDAGV